MCGSYVARTFFDLKGKRIYLCQPDAYALLRLAFKEQSDSMRQVYNMLESVVYGREESSLDTPVDLPLTIQAPVPNGGPF